ncbi:hypothetical protein [Pedobacter sp. SYSU D00535]|uniref:hypothetical protein n=1 Tax=Pedobacter sp. SYSU D00535 TaxID=2810308 RepID=UPI001A969D8D|nr:hypothetical protein [Pedobacter sp. SYSU D00535]
MRLGFIYYLLLPLFLLLACNDGKREKELEKKEAELEKKEQELILREKNLQLKEQELAKADSSKIKADTSVYSADLPGRWKVHMVCINTTCPSSAIGDTKNEEWVIAYENQKVVARAMVNNKLVRLYSGIYNGTTLNLTAQPATEEPQQSTEMVVQLHLTNPTRMEGRREITREEGCTIVYSVELSK